MKVSCSLDPIWSNQLPFEAKTQSRRANARCSSSPVVCKRSSYLALKDFSKVVGGMWCLTSPTQLTSCAVGSSGVKLQAGAVRLRINFPRNHQMMSETFRRLGAVERLEVISGDNVMAAAFAASGFEHTQNRNVWRNSALREDVFMVPLNTVCSGILVRKCGRLWLDFSSTMCRVCARCSPSQPRLTRSAGGSMPPSAIRHLSLAKYNYS
jgi:hypothetical protein